MFKQDGKQFNGNCGGMALIKVRLESLTFNTGTHTSDTGTF